jgi:hypothetical protein
VLDDIAWKCPDFWLEGRTAHEYWNLEVVAERDSDIFRVVSIEDDDVSPMNLR